MRMHERYLRVSKAKTELQIKLGDYKEQRDLSNVEFLRAVTLEIREILLGMSDDGSTKIKRPQLFSNLKDMIKAHQSEHELTDIEVLQALFGFCDLELKYMLRYERHGNYEFPAEVG